MQYKSVNYVVFIRSRNKQSSTTVCPSSCTYNMTCYEMRNFSPMDMFPMNLDMDFNPFVCASCECPVGTSKGKFIVCFVNIT